MKRPVCILLLFALLLCACARADDWDPDQWDDWNVEQWVSEYTDKYYYHAAENCRLARYSGALKRVGSDAGGDDSGQSKLIQLERDVCRRTSWFA